MFIQTLFEIFPGQGMHYCPKQPDSAWHSFIFFSRLFLLLGHWPSWDFPMLVVLFLVFFPGIHGRGLICLPLLVRHWKGCILSSLPGFSLGLKSSSSFHWASITASSLHTTMAYLLIITSLSVFLFKCYVQFMMHSNVAWCVLSYLLWDLVSWTFPLFMALLSISFSLSQIRQAIATCMLKCPDVLNNQSVWWTELLN